jgi:hypothetical protein
MKKTILWKSLCESETLEMFVNMIEYLEENGYASEKIKPHVLTHLTNLESNFKNRFLDLALQQHEWMRNPFAVTIGEKISHLSIKAKESLMELSCDISLKMKFEALSLPEFWIHIKNHSWNSHNQPPNCYYFLKRHIYVKKKTFSAMAVIKSKYRNSFQLGSDLRLFLSTTQPRMSHLVSNMQAQPSH